MKLLVVKSSKKRPTVLNVALLRRISIGSDALFFDWDEAQGYEAVSLVPDLVLKALDAVLYALRDDPEVAWPREVDLTPYQTPVL